MGDYHDCYLKTGVLLLNEVFEKFISACLECYGLDPCGYFSSPELNWDAILKMTKTEFELVSDIDMYLFIYLLKNEWEDAFFTLLKDLVKQIKNTWNSMMITNQENILCIWI